MKKSRSLEVRRRFGMRCRSFRRAGRSLHSEGSQDRLYTSSIKSLNQSGRARSTYAARKGTMGTMKNMMSTAIKPMAMSQICRSEMAGGGTVDSAWGM